MDTEMFFFFFFTLKVKVQRSSYTALKIITVFQRQDKQLLSLEQEIAATTIFQSFFFPLCINYQIE